MEDVLVPHAHLEEFTGPDKIAQLLVPIVHGRERTIVGNVLANLAQMGPSIVICSLFHGSSQSSHQNSVAPQFVPAPFGFNGWFWRAAVAVVIGFLCIFSQVLCVDELRTGVDEWHGSFALAEAKDRQSGFENSHHQGRKVGIAGHEGEGIDVATVEQVHGVNDH